MKEGKVFKRILAVALVVVMTITMVPFGVFAEGEETTTLDAGSSEVVTPGEGETPAEPECAHIKDVDSKYQNAKSATCEENGMKAHYLCKCGVKVQYPSIDNPMVVTDEYLKIPATGHTEETLEAVESTCSSTGLTEGKKCSVCGKILVAQTVTDKKAHTEETLAAVAPTCTEEGKTEGKKCSVCNEVLVPQTPVIATGHRYGTDGKCTNAGCTETCPHSGEKVTIPGTPATCTKPGVSDGEKCKDCGAVTKIQTVISALNHPAESVETKDAVAATCLTEGSTAGKYCKLCEKWIEGNEAIPALGHDVAGVAITKASETQHGKLCKREGCGVYVDLANHDYTEIIASSAATCVTEGSETAKCACGATKTSVLPKNENHDWGTWTETKAATCTDAGSRERSCKRNGCTDKDVEALAALGHKWDEGTVTTAPTCKEKGAKLHKCENAGCDETKVEEMAIVDHDYQPVVTQPTCTEDGYTTYTCSMCKSHYVDDQVDAFGHMFDTYYYDEGSATCYQDGTKTATCSNGCGAKNTVADPGSKTDHEVTDFTVIKEATCLEEGEQEAKCFYYDKCGYSEIVPIDALGHDIPADFVTDKEPTCTEKGSKSKKCTRCSETVATEEIPALGHAVNTDYTVDVAATCLEAGKQSKHCARCDYKEGETTIPALGHDYQPAAGTEATCLEGGYAKFTCTRCADTYEEANRPALGHNFVYISDNNATCKEDGTESGKCSRCDATDTRTQVGSKLSHVLGEPVVTPATTKADGVITKTCTLCNDYNETEEIAKIAGMKLTYTVVAYDGKYKRPGLTITDANGTKLVKGEDYTLVLPTKEECSEIGTFTYTINFMGNYKGKGTISYKVVPGKAAKLVAKTTRQSYITLKWSAVKGADGYRVYVKNSKGNWKKLATVKGKNYYKVEDLKAGTEYEFAVKAYAKTDDGTVWATEYIEGAFKTLPGKTSKITYKSNKSAVKLTWKEVKGADGYRVYVYNTKTKKYTTVATVKGKTSYTVKELKAGTTYKFAVKAYYKYDGATVWSNQYTTINTKTAK